MPEARTGDVDIKAVTLNNKVIRVAYTQAGITVHAPGLAMFVAHVVALTADGKPEPEALAWMHDQGMQLLATIAPKARRGAK